MDPATVLIVPGLRDAVASHWQTLLHEQLQAAGRPVRSVPPIGRDEPALLPRLAMLEAAAQEITGPLVLVAHSGGCITVAHWAMQTRRLVAGALLATPPDFESAMPTGYPTLGSLRAGGWLPLPRERLPFPSLVATSSDDPLGREDRVAELAAAWGARQVALGAVGHLNPASGFGPWPRALSLIDELGV